MESTVTPLLAEFIETPIDEEKWELILLHCSFDYMKENATKSVPLGGASRDGGAQTFIHKGTSGRWRDILQKDESLKIKTESAFESEPTANHRRS